MRAFRDYRSKARYGILDMKEKRKYQELVEVDITKAYTSAFDQINEIPVFNEFDIWKKYNNEDIKDLSLYLVESHEGNLFFDKKVNFCFVKFIEKKRKFIKRNIGVKQPSSIKKINCKKMIEELYKQKISTNPHLDMRLKKISVIFS